jgi:hypothetical protein
MSTSRFATVEDNNPKIAPTLSEMKYVKVNHRSPSPLSSDHLEWRCRVDGKSTEPIVITALIDNGSHAVLIDEGLVSNLGLKRRRLPSPQRARLAMGEGEVEFTEWIKLRVFSEDRQWTSRVVRAIVTPKLAYPVLLGGPFLKSNKIVVDHEDGLVTSKIGGTSFCRPRNRGLLQQQRV